QACMHNVYVQMTSLATWAEQKPRVGSALLPRVRGQGEAAARHLRRPHQAGSPPGSRWMSPAARLWPSPEGREGDAAAASLALPSQPPSVWAGKGRARLPATI